jgi:hypothetical protein
MVRFGIQHPILCKEWALTLICFSPIAPFVSLSEQSAQISKLPPRLSNNAA